MAGRPLGTESPAQRAQRGSQLFIYHPTTYYPTIYPSLHTFYDPSLHTFSYTYHTECHNKKPTKGLFINPTHKWVG